MRGQWLLSLALSSLGVQALRYDERYVDWNLNMAQDATDPLDYFTVYDNHTYHPSPDNWRFPFYSFFMDRNGTAWEHDIYGTQLRHGGDTEGVRESLDYLQGMGVRGIYLAGSIFYNFPWMSDTYSPLDHTYLDAHFGTIAQWRELINDIHSRGMYVLLDNTMATMSDVIAFEGYYNSSAPWSFKEHKAVWKSGERYQDWEFKNEWHDECPYEYPRFWDQGGALIQDENTTKMIGCMDSEFDQYGDVGAFGQYPEWQKQLSKFNGVQDRLRDWRPSVQTKLQHFMCMMLKALDFDGFRIDKAMQVTVDGQGNFSHAMRECAASIGKYNFFIPGEIVNGNANGAIYIGRGKEPSMQVDNLTEAATTNSTYIREDGYQALDAGAFHYTIYRGLMRFLGLDGNLLAASDAPVNFIDAWHVMVQTNDFVNANNGKFDPRHMYGVSNQDVLRWPGLINGTQRQVLGSFVNTLVVPGISMISWGEEQLFYVLDNTAANYIYGRQSMSSAQAWQMHGCYKVGDENLSNFPVNSSLVGCQDDAVSLDHRDPTHPMYNYLKMGHEMRRRYPVLNDGFDVRQLSNQTFHYYLNGSFGEPTETGIWSIYRGELEGAQDLSDAGGYGNQPVWLLMSNYNGSRNYTFDCSSTSGQAIISPYDAGTTVKNLYYPFDERTLEPSKQKLHLNGSTEYNGCLPWLNMTMYGFAAFVPKDVWEAPSPSLTKMILNDTFIGHDSRIMVSDEDKETLTLELRFSGEMDCDSVRRSINITSTTGDGSVAVIDTDSVDCLTTELLDEPLFYGARPSIWRYRTNITNVANGIHTISVNNATSASQDTFTGSKDNLMFRVGQIDNPMVFPFKANYSSTLLFSSNGKTKRASESSGTAEDAFYVQHKAPGADKWRYSLTWGADWSDWMDYQGGNSTLDKQTWAGTKRQKWSGDHVKVQYWSKASGSSDHIQEGDVFGSTEHVRRFPHFFVHGSFNEYGYDSGLDNKMKLVGNSTWEYDFMTEWPSQFQLNVWGMTEDGEPDVSAAFGDIDNDTVLDRIGPTSLEMSVVNITDHGPESPFLAWRIHFNDASFRYVLLPVGNRWRQLALFILLAVIPPVTALLGIYFYKKAFYAVKHNLIGLSDPKSLIPIAIRNKFSKGEVLDEKAVAVSSSSESVGADVVMDNGGLVTAGAMVKRRTVLIGTMEYDISDWNIKIKIGGLGVMAQLMGKNLQHQDLIWVVPCVGGIDYPVDTPGEPVDVTILGKVYEVQVQYHKLENITYMLLDAPVFRKQSAKEPYPARMDDLDSAIYYSAWNQCIAEACRRFPIDLYHINDYHGTIAPLYLLPQTIPVCLSLHNAEFQGLWPMRNAKERAEVCSVYNLSESVVAKYVQFGEIFNLLHAGASLLRLHQKGFGAVGVSKKYGKRSWARYPIFWGLNSIGALPNPDPSDVAEWDKKLADPNDAVIDEVYESSRAGLRRQAQEWAGLDVKPDADLFVFVGRWSMQKGIDLIADVFPAILEKNPNVQLLCVGPCIDLYGKFAALKLDVMMKKYPGRVYSKPEFTALPPFIFSGAEFALIPSRDEPFGLVAVEFGRKGALGVGSRVGGLGQMPGWWYTIESQTTKHQMHQFKMAIDGALKSKYETRALMRARSAKQRFPVAQWKEDLEILQSKSIKIHDKRMEKKQRNGGMSVATTPWGSGYNTPNMPGWMTPSGWTTPGAGTPWGRGTPNPSRPNTRPSSPTREGNTAESSPTNSRNNSLSLGTRAGPGHVQTRARSFSGSRPTLSRRNSTEPTQGRNRLSRIEDEEVNITTEEAQHAREQAQEEARSGYPFLNQDPFGANSPYTFSPAGTPGIASPSASSPFLPFPPSLGRSANAESTLTVDKVIEQKEDKTPQDLLPFFTDSTGLYYRTFERKLEDLSGKTSESALCIEDYLEKSEKQWFNRMHDVKMAKETPAATRANSPTGAYNTTNMDPEKETSDQFLLPQNYQAPTGVRRLMMYKVGDWPIYSFFLALGQIIAANSYQITLLTGEIGETASKLYVVACIYLGASLVWWFVFRRFALIYTIALPWFFYGFAFFLLGMAPYAATNSGRGWVQNVATGFYSFASAAGSFFFAQNFGSTGSAPVKTWGFRACMIQGTQQLYIVGLWYWGDKLSALSDSGKGASTLVTYGSTMTAIGVPIAVFLWAIGILLWLGLPAFYRQAPGAVPSFYTAVMRRKIIVWFFVAVFVQNYFLASIYGRNWKYLWSSKHAPGWSIFLLIVLFFVIIWAFALWWFSHLSTTHSWFIPIFAIGLGAPRWCQILWSCSNIGMYLPWAGSPVASALLGRGLWLWLGVLDSVQGIGFGMILLQTLTRYHITFTLVAAQVIGSVATILSRATAPDATGPGDVFPDFSVDWKSGLASADFWVCLLLQLGICVGFFTFFRKEQLSKP
ncbi:MAG: Amidase signature enzyme [Aureobasidium pullulans]|nr:MAG: SGNH hydrolase [Aureobasidium pullulans]OBW67983.1 MAG: Amidase signature enzyme [Aureobasidium pullulans]